MRRLVTFVAVLDMAVVELATSMEVEGGSSSAGDTSAGAPELALPKANFHLDGFLVTGAGNSLVCGSCFTACALIEGTGKANIETGSWGLRVLLERCEETMEVLLSSLAKF